MASGITLAVALIVAIVCSGAAPRGEIIDRVLAILPGQIITQSDVEAALDFGLVAAPPSGDRIAGALAALIDRVLMLNEVRRVVPREPSPAAVDARLQLIRQRFESADAFSRAMNVRGVDEAVLRIHAADEVRLSSYLDERFSAASQPTDEEIRQAGEAARPSLVAERRQALIGAWVAELRRRVEVTVLQ